MTIDEDQQKLDDAARALYVAMRRYRPELPDVGQYKKVTVGKDLSVKFSRIEGDINAKVAFISMELVLFDDYENVPDE